MNPLTVKALKVTGDLGILSQRPHVPTDEPLDRLSPSDIAIINGALHIYYAESRDCLADAKQLQQIRSISRRLADVSLRWVAEEVTE